MLRRNTLSQTASFRVPSFCLYENEDQKEFRKAIVEFAEKKIKPVMSIKSKSIPKSVWHALGKQGLLGVGIPSKYGGIEMGNTGTVISMEEIRSFY